METINNPPSAKPVDAPCAGVAPARLGGALDRDLSTLPAYCEAVSRACDVPIPVNYPVVGSDAFRTASGVHAAAVVKAFRKNDRSIMDAVYASVPATLVGRAQEIDVGPMSGKSNVVYWLESRGLPATDDIVDRIFSAAKAAKRTLTAPCPRIAPQGGVFV